MLHFGLANFYRDMQALDLKEEATALWRHGYLEQALPLMAQSVMLREDSQFICLSLSELGALFVEMLKLDEAESTARRMLHEAYRYDTQAQTRIAAGILNNVAEERARGLFYGSAVQLHSLKKMPELNGVVGEIRGTVGDGSHPIRYRVLVGSTVLSVKEVNFSMATVILQLSVECKNGRSWNWVGRSMGGDVRAHFNVDMARITATLARSKLAESAGLPPSAVRLVLPGGGTLEDGPAGDAALRRCADAAVESAVDGDGGDDALVEDLGHLSAAEQSRDPLRGAGVRRAAYGQMLNGYVGQYRNKCENDYLEQLTRQEVEACNARGGRPVESAQTRRSSTGRSSTQPIGDACDGQSLGHSCKRCGASSSDERPQLLPCPRCNRALYCSEECERVDRRAHRHACKRAAKKMDTYGARQAGGN